MTLTLGTKQSFTPAHTHRCGVEYALFPAQFGGGGCRGGALVWNPEGDPDRTRVRAGAPGCAQAPRRAQAASWALPEPHPLPAQVAGRGFGNRGARAGEEGGGRTWPGGRSGRCPPRPLSF